MLSNVVKKETIITIQDIHKQFGSVKILKGIDFKIYKQENLAIVGGNGSGKTTLLEIIAGLNKPTSGRVYYHEKQRDIGVQFQDSSYPQGISVDEVIHSMLGLYKAKITINELWNLVCIFGVDEFIKKKAKSLSGGQLQRLNLLLSIIHRPKIIFLDEISTGLDVVLKKQIHGYLIKFAKENCSTIIVISHDYDEIEKMCQRVVVINKGELKYNGLVAEIISKYRLSSRLEEFIF